MEPERVEKKTKPCGKGKVKGHGKASAPTPGVVIENGTLSSALQDKIYIPEGSHLEYVSIKKEVDEDLPMDPGTLDVSGDLVDVKLEEGILPDSMFECCYCKILFAVPQALTEHLEEAHQDMADYDRTLERVAKDTEVFKIETKMEESGNSTGGKKKRMYKNIGLVCDYPGCGKKFIRRGALRTHHVVHEVSKECPHCGTAFKTVTALIRHIDRKHNVRKSCKVDCTFPGCHKTFHNPAVLKNHQHFHDERYRCVQCGVLFLQANSLEKHVQSVHSGREPQNLVECTSCGEMVPTWSIAKHLQRACRGQESLKSPSLGAEEEDGGYHIWNEFSEIDDVPIEGVEFKCANEGCMVSFETKRMLAWHLKYTFHHEYLQDGLPFHCPYKACQKHYPNKEELGDHMREEHWGTKKIKTAAAQKQAREAREASVKAERPDTQRKCPVCCETFINESKMKLHLRVAHSHDEIPPDCDQLENSTETEDEKNVDLVFDLKMYRCPICQATYHTAGGLKYHIRIHHKYVDSALDFLCELESNSEAFLHVVPATLYGDSFKSRRRTSQAASGPSSSKRIREISDIKPEPESNSPVNLCKADVNENVNDTIESDSPEVRVDLDESATGSGENLNTSAESSQDLDTLEKTDSKTEESESSEKVGEHKEQDDKEKGNSDKKKPGHKNVNLVCRYPNCFKSFKARFELMCHQRTHKRLLKCPHEGCTHEFFNSNNLRLHIQMVHSEANDTKCKDCGIVGKRSYIIYRHPKFCPKTADLKCPKCDKVFKKVSSFTNHVRTHDKAPQQNYLCEYDNCTKRFRTRQDRDRHHNVHSGARPHKCPYAGCNKTYKQRPHLLVHMKNTHTLRKEEDTTVFICEHCNGKFKRSCGRSKHIRKSCVQGPYREQILAARRKPLTAKGGTRTRTRATAKKSIKEDSPSSSDE